MKARLVALAFAAVALLAGADGPPRPSTLDVRGFVPDFSRLTIPGSPQVAAPLAPTTAGSIQTMALFALVSLAPAAALMVTAFVRISIVLTLLRQALGSPQIPGNQVLTALALLLTALVMRPVGESVYQRGIRPYSEGRLSAGPAWEAGTAPIKAFMIEQICRAKHESYCADLYDRSAHAPDEREPEVMEDYSLAILAPAFLLSELTTALFIGFAIYLPFLVIDLVVSAVLGAMGLFMLPPSLVSLPLKLALFVLADGWMLVAGMLLRSFSG